MKGAAGCACHAPRASRQARGRARAGHRLRLGPFPSGTDARSLVGKVARIQAICSLRSRACARSAGALSTEGHHALRRKVERGGPRDHCCRPPGTSDASSSSCSLPPRPRRVPSYAIHPRRRTSGSRSCRAIFLTRFARPSLQRANHLFLLCSNTDRQVQFERNAIEAAKRARFNHIVKLSALGLPLPRRFQLARWHAEVERKLKACGIGWTILQPTYFAQT